jgi:P-type E1-E2 ATPase
MVERRKELEHKIERNLTLIGAVAIEDKLQDEVAEVLSQFKQSGIKINMLTGDKLQTAINIGKACKIIEEETII